MLKDLKLAMEAAESAGMETPLGAHAKALYEKFAEGHSDLDFSAIIKESLAAPEIHRRDRNQ